MKSSQKVPVVILNGFLGSGKTTLFRKLLAQAGKKRIPVCAIVNDMSSLDIDGELIANMDMVEANSQIMESIHSCVLSSKLGIEKLDKAIANLLSTQQPELIIIETSGSCHPLPLVEYFKSHKSTRLTGVFALLDALMLAHDYNYGERLIPEMKETMMNGHREAVNLLVEQIMFCSHLLLTKTDRVDKERLPEIADAVTSINPYASTHEVMFGNLTIESLFELPEYNFHTVAQLTQELRPVLELDERADMPYDLATRVIKDDRPFHPQRLWDTCHEFLDQRIYRSKGFFWLASRDKISLLWSQAAGSISLELIGYWRTGIVEDENHRLTEIEIKLLKKQLQGETGRFGDRHCDLTVIGHEEQVDRFTEALKACFLTDEEMEQYKRGDDFEDPWPQRIVKMVGLEETA